MTLDESIRLNLQAAPNQRVKVSELRARLAHVSNIALSRAIRQHYEIRPGGQNIRWIIGAKLRPYTDLPEIEFRGQNGNGYFHFRGEQFGQSAMAAKLVTMGCDPQVVNNRLRALRTSQA